MSSTPKVLDPPHQPPEFLLKVLKPTPSGNSPVSVFLDGGDPPPSPISPVENRPYVTLTFSQSLDAKIAGKGGKQLILSGKESMIMTHWMRTMHDAILVGVGTALNDNPQLNTRHLPPLPEGTKFNYSLPRPVILDTHLRSSLESKLLNNYRSGIGRRPWIVASRPFGNQYVACNWDGKRIALEKAGARIIEVPQIQGRISVPGLLKELKGLGIRSLMVEGGARVIKSFLVAATPSGSSPGSVDTVLVTVAPVFVGEDGTGYGSELASDELPVLEYSQTQVFGKDAVLAIHTRR